MANKIIFDRFGEPYPHNQDINAKLDFLIESVSELKSDVTVLKKDVERLDKKIDDAATNLNKKIDKVDESNKSAIAEIKAEIHLARWQIIAVMISVVAMVAAIVSALK